MPSSKSALANRRASRVSLESIRMFSPDGSASAPPKLNSSERQFRLASAHCENWIPVGWPLGLSVRAATRASSQVSGGLRPAWSNRRSEEHTSELQSQSNLVCRLLLEYTAPVLPA